MSREVRRVPANWKHPKDERGHLIPLYGDSFSKRAAEWDEKATQWDKGFHRFYGGEWRPKEPSQTGTFEEYDGSRPQGHEYMPDWPEAERTHYQMYETVTEGTPISPVMETPEALARWLADNNGNAGAYRTATYEQWLVMIQGDGWAPSLVNIQGKSIVSGVEALSGQ